MTTANTLLTVYDLMLAQRAVVVRASDGSSVRIDRFPVVLGRFHPGAPRQPDCDLSALDVEGRVSRQHASLGWDDGRLVVTDLGSTNGTWLNGQRLQPFQPDSAGEAAELTLGHLTLIVEVEPEPDESATVILPATPTPTASVPPAAVGALTGLATVMLAVDAAARRVVSQELGSPSSAEAADASSGAVAGAPPGAPAPAHVIDAEFDRLEVFQPFADPAVRAVVFQPGHRLRVCRSGTWPELGADEVTRAAWDSLWTAFCQLAGIDSSAGGYVTAALEGGVLAEAMIPPLAVGPVFFAERRPAALTLSDLVTSGVVDVAHAALLHNALAARQGIIVVGPPQSGRTALLEALVDSIPEGQRVAVVERRPRMRLTSPDAIRLRSADGQGAAAVAAAMSATPSWVVIDDADPDAAAEISRRLTGGCGAILAARSDDAQRWRRRAADHLLGLVGDAKRGRDEIDTTFPLTVRVAPDEGRFRVIGVDQS